MPLSWLQLWWSHEWAHSVLSSTAPLSRCRRVSVASFMGSVHFMFGPLFSCCIIVFSQHYCTFQRTLPSRDMPEESSHFAIFASGDVSGFICSGTRLFILLMAQRSCRALLQHHIASGLSFSPSAFFTLQLLANIHSPWECQVVDSLALVCDDTALLSVIFPISSTAALLGRSPL